MAKQYFTDGKTILHRWLKYTKQITELCLTADKTLLLRWRKSVSHKTKRNLQRSTVSSLQIHNMIPY